MHRHRGFSKFFVAFNDKMKKNKKWIFLIVLALGLILGGLWAGQRLLYFIGEREIYLAAKENNYCHDETCQEGMSELVAFLEQQTGITAELVPWCMAANAIYTTPFITLNQLKDKFADWMYQSCGHDDVTVEDIVLSIGEPE